MTKSKGILRPKSFWTAEQLATLRARYADERSEDIAKDIGRDLRSVYCKAQKLGLKKSEAFLSSPAAGRLDGIKGMGTRFAKGGTSWNKGIHYQAGGRSVETHFKPGNKPHTWRPIGTERVTKDGYLQRKVADTGNTVNDYVEVHRLLWEEVNGEVPKDHVIVFKDGNKQNITIDNLECISRQELINRNKIQNLPKELVELIHLRGVLTRQINKRSKSHEQ